MKAELARRNLIRFTEFTNPDYQCAAHHKLIAEKLEAVERGDCKRLMIFMPPRHGKSELASRRFPAWYLGRNPNRQIIAASYNSDLASDFGRDVRNIVNEPEYGQVFNEVSLKPDSKAANRWHVNGGGVYVAAGVGTAVTGRGADLGLIDDPFKDRKEADSENQRETVWNWYTSTFRTRLMPGGAIILIQTRWHEDDLAGRLLASEGADEWEILDLPALQSENPPSGALWPEWYPVEELVKIKRDIGPREWSALYQQKPQPDDGDFFKRDWFNWYDPNNKPKNVNIYNTSDYAVTEGSGDFTEHSVWAVNSDDDLYLFDNWHGQTAADEWIEKKLDLIEQYKPLIVFGEGGVIRKSIEPFLMKRKNERRVYFRMEWMNPISDKPTRARSFQGRAASGKVYLPDNEIGQRALDQLLRFPAGKNDDFVDTASMIGLALDDTRAAQAPTPKLDEAYKDGYWPKEEDTNWKTV